MASTREIRRRIQAVKNVAQITRAVQMVASSKMRRAQERVRAGRPYSEQLIKLLSRLAGQAEGLEDLPLMKTRPLHSVAIVVVTPDRGLAGAFSSNVNRRAAQLAIELRREHGADLAISFIAVGPSQDQHGHSVPSTSAIASLVASAASSAVGRSPSVASSTNGVRNVMYRDIVD